MKHFYLRAGKALMAFFLFVMPGSNAWSQAFTSAGDIAFTGYISTHTTNIESFSFVILKNIGAGQTLTFTDNGWTGTALQTGESTITWTTGSALVAGREVTISGTAAAAAASCTVTISGSSINAGTLSGTMVNLPSSGDQIFAYVGTAASPTFIAGIHMNSYTLGTDPCGSTSVAGWDPTGCVTNANGSALPGTLTGGSTAVWIGIAGVANSDSNNARYICVGPLATAAQVRNSVNNYTPNSNWDCDDNTPPPFTLPSGCAFLASIFALDLTSFSGASQTGSIGLNWQTANEPNDNGYFEVEKSADGFNFTTLGRVHAQGFSYLYNNYSYTDNAPLSGANFYRLKIVSNNGFTKYSYVVKVLYGRQGRGMIVSPNPAVSEVTLTTAGDYTQVIISDRNGRTVLQQKLSGNNNRIDVSRLPAGQYSITAFSGTEKTTEKLLIVH